MADIPGGLNVQAREPLDGKYKRLNLVDLDSGLTFQGLQRFIAGENKLYILLDSGWQQILTEETLATAFSIEINNTELSTYPYVENIGTDQHVVLNFGIPKGEKGQAATIYIQSVTASPDSDFHIYNDGDQYNASYRLQIPPITMSLGNLTDVITTGVTNGQVLTFRASDSKWIPSSVSSSGGDMLKSTYDINNNGIVDNSEKLGTQLPSYYLSQDNMTNGTTNKNYTSTEQSKLAGIIVETFQTNDYSANTTITFDFASSNSRIITASTAGITLTLNTSNRLQGRSKYIDITNNSSGAITISIPTWKRFGEVTTTSYSLAAGKTLLISLTCPTTVDAESAIRAGLSISNN